MIRRKVQIPDIKTVGYTQPELHTLEFEKLDVCIRPLFANPVTYVAMYVSLATYVHT